MSGRVGTCSHDAFYLLQVIFLQVSCVSVMWVSDVRTFSCQLHHSCSNSLSFNEAAVRVLRLPQGCACAPCFCINMDVMGSEDRADPHRTWRKGPPLPPHGEAPNTCRPAQEMFHQHFMLKAIFSFFYKKTIKGVQYEKNRISFKGSKYSSPLTLI